MDENHPMCRAKRLFLFAQEGAQKAVFNSAGSCDLQILENFSFDSVGFGLDLLRCRTVRGAGGTQNK